MSEMTVIERKWTIYKAADRPAYAAARHEWIEGPPTVDDEGPVPVEVVPAEQLRGAVAERDRAYRTIAEIEKALTDYGVAITAPLADAILDLLEKR